MILNSIVAADLWFENMLLGVRTPFGLQVFNAVTFFGNTGTVILIAGIVGAILLLNKNYRPYLIGLVTTLAGAAGSAYVLKEIVARARPGGLIPYAAVETSFSFPSGHATASMALYGFIAFILYRLYPRYKTVIVMVATLIILSIGFSRLYLGLHFPSDVIAGYVVGGVWVWIGSKLVQKLQTPR